ncbi:hypothetical protein PV326_003144 [Microctonus aethiopoides]|nr:hypothetical protein PV326_003144 [Microctonus aethiopoides]
MIDTEYILLLIILGILVIVVLFDGIFWMLIIAVIYGSGKFWGGKLLGFIGINFDNSKKQYIGKSNDEKICKICSGSGCNRHRQNIHNIHVKVPRDFDIALQNLLEKILQTYVCTWYSNFSSDEAFVQQLRLIIATAVRNIIGRLLRVNMSEVIFNNLIPIALEHAQDWQVLFEHAQKKSGKPEDYALDYLGHKIHPAAYSREAEMNYIKGLVTGLLPHLLPSTYMSTNNKVILREILSNWVLLPAMDALADPDNINLLIKLSTECEGVLFQEIDSINVPVLQTWVTPVIAAQTSEHPLKPSLDQVLNDPQLLYLFMQHIKETGPVNLLQFCLDIDDLSKRMLNPDMTKEIEINLYTDAQSIYSTYLDPESSEYLNLPWHISAGMQEILDSGPSNVQELRTSRPLYQAHQEAHAMLEAICLPSFHHSYELYKLLCGTPAMSSFTKSSTPSGMSGSAGMGARLSNQFGKIRGVLRASTVDGAAFQAPDVFQAEEVDCSSRIYNDGAIYGDKCNRDLTTWRVTVPHVDGGGSNPLYMVEVHSVAEDKTWTVLRRDQDFYTLRARLMEFHGDRELNDSPLPTRKNQNVSLIANRQRYQDFLQTLLAKSTLRSSELLYTFLSVPDLKPYYTNYSTPDIGILYQSVAHKLRKEKGQHLDKFMNTFLASTAVEHEHVNLGVDPINDHCFIDLIKKGKDLTTSAFANNLNIININHNLPYIISKKTHVKGACFCIAEAVENLLHVSPSTSTIIWLIASLSRPCVDPISNKFLHATLEKLLSDGRASMVVKLLHNVMFDTRNSNKSPTTNDEERYKSAKEGLYSLLPWWCFGIRTHYWHKMMDALLNPLQNAPLNKHLAYLLVDQVVATLFPEISQ